MSRAAQIRPAIPKTKSSLLATLQEQIHSLEGTHERFSRTVTISKAIDSWLPHGGLPLGCIHEVKGTSLASAIAFASLLSARLAEGYILFIAPDRSLYPLGLLPYGVDIKRLVHIHIAKSQNLGWATLEALRCPQVSAVLSVMECTDLTACRRLQLAAETSSATGFFIGNLASRQIASPVTRWRILPGIVSAQRFDEPQWTIELLYCRGGRPGRWMTTWRNCELEIIHPLQEILPKPVQHLTLRSSEALTG